MIDGEIGHNFGGIDLNFETIRWVGAMGVASDLTTTTLGEPNHGAWMDGSSFTYWNWYMRKNEPFNDGAEYFEFHQGGSCGAGSEDYCVKNRGDDLYFEPNDYNALKDIPKQFLTIGTDFSDTVTSAPMRQWTESYSSYPLSDDGVCSGVILRTEPYMKQSICWKK